MNRSRKKYLSLLVQKARDRDLSRIIDCHFHPVDVLGYCGPTHTHRDFVQSVSYRGRYGLAEFLKYGRAYILLTRLLFLLSPNSVRSIIKSFYQFRYTEIELLKILDFIGLDKAVLLPLAPYVSHEYLFREFVSDRFIIFGSLDPKSSGMEGDLEKLSKLKVKGIKLHPNLQNFSPVPERNIDFIGKNLHTLYKYAEKNKICILFHAGRTNYLERSKRQMSQLADFFYDTNKSILDVYDIKIIFAHLGSYASTTVDLNMMKLLVEQYDQRVAFDTSGMSPQYIYRSLNNVGYKFVIFGSDAFYNDPLSSYYFCLDAVDASSSLRDRLKNIKLVFSQNLEDRLLDI